MENLYIPTRHDIDSLKEGDMAPDCFGTCSKVLRVFARGVDVEGRAYVCYYTEFGETSSISCSLKEGKIHRNVALTGKFSSHELDVMELKFSQLAGEFYASSNIAH